MLTYIDAKAILDHRNHRSYTMTLYWWRGVKCNVKWIPFFQFSKL